MSEALRIAAQAAIALDAAHAQQVIHRDLKPAILFLLTDGRLKICDFGIARTAEVTAGLTLTGQPFGTPPTSHLSNAAERTSMPDVICTSSDACCTPLTGRLPFPATEQAWALMRRYLEDVPPRLRSTRVDIPVDGDQLVAPSWPRTLQTDPASATSSTPSQARRTRTTPLPHLPLIRLSMQPAQAQSPAATTTRAAKGAEQGAACVPAESHGSRQAGRTGGHGPGVPRGHCDENAVDEAAEPVTLELGVRVSNAKGHRDNSLPSSAALAASGVE